MSRESTWIAHGRQTENETDFQAFVTSLTYSLTNPLRWTRRSTWSERKKISLELIIMFVVCFFCAWTICRMLRSLFSSRYQNRSHTRQAIQVTEKKKKIHGNLTEIIRRRRGGAQKKNIRNFYCKLIAGFYNWQVANVIKKIHSRSIVDTNYCSQLNELLKREIWHFQM